MLTYVQLFDKLYLALNLFYLLLCEVNNTFERSKEKELQRKALHTKQGQNI